MAIPEVPQPSLETHMTAAREAARQYFAADRAGAEYEARKQRDTWEGDLFFQLFTGVIDQGTFADRMGDAMVTALRLDHEFRPIREDLNITRDDDGE